MDEGGVPLASYTRFASNAVYAMDERIAYQHKLNRLTDGVIHLAAESHVNEHTLPSPSRQTGREERLGRQAVPAGLNGRGVRHPAI